MAHNDVLNQAIAGIAATLAVYEQNLWPEDIRTLEGAMHILQGLKK
jgi:hypothetical protein